MSRLIMWNLVTLDGYFEGAKPWDLGWHQSVWGEELERLSIEQLKTADRLLFGRRTYEGMAAYWQSKQGEVATLMNALPKVVASRTLARASWTNSQLVSTDVVAAVTRLKGEGRGETLVFGSADLSATLAEHGLFDEYRILVAPVAIGTGTALFGRGRAIPALRLLRTRVLKSGGVILSYEPGAVTS
jgi:dihydrofolate reductase